MILIDNKIIELANLYGIEINDKPGSILIDKDGNERPVTEDDIDIIFGIDKFYRGDFNG